MIHDHHPTHKLVNWIAFSAMGLIIIALGILFYWASAPDKVLEVKEIPIPIRIVKDGPATTGIVVLHVDYCKYRDIEGKLRMSFVSNSKEVFLPLTPERGPKTCRETELPVVLPKDLSPDTYHIKFRVQYELNPLKTTTNEFETKEFTVQ